MSNTIQIKRRTSGSGTLASLLEGELGVDLTDSNKLYVGTSGGNQLLNPSASTSYLPLAGGTLTNTSQPVLKTAYNADHYLGIGHHYIDLNFSSYTNDLELRTGGTPRLTIHRSTGNATFSGTITATGGTFAGNNSATPLTVNGGTATLASIQLNGGTNAVDNSSIQAKYSLVLASNSTNAIASRAILFKNGTSEHARFDSDGALLINTTSKGSSSGKLYAGSPYTTSSAIAQFNGFLRYGFGITHDATRGLYPHVTGQGSIGMDSQRYGKGFFNRLDIGAANAGEQTSFGDLVLMKQGNTNADGFAVVGTNGNPSLRLWVDSSGNRKINAGTTEVFSFTTSAITLTQPTTLSSSLTTGGDITISSGNAGLRLHDTTNGSNFVIFSNSSELRMAQVNASFPGAYLNLTTGGNLGLGVTGASERLEVSGKAIFTDAVSVGQSSAPSGNNKFEVYNTSGNYNAVFKNSGQATLEVQGGENSSARIRLIPDEGDDVNNADHFQLIHETSNNFELQRYNTTSGWAWKWKLDSSNNVHQTGNLTVGGNIMLTSGAILTNHSSHNNYGFQIKSADNTQSALELRDNNNNWKATFYGATSAYGFLDGPWGNWDIRKAVDGALQIDQGSGLETVLTNATGLQLTGGSLTGDLKVGNTAVHLASAFSNQKGFSVNATTGRTDAVGNNVSGLQVGRYGGGGAIQIWRYASNQIGEISNSALTLNVPFTATGGTLSGDLTLSKATPKIVLTNTTPNPDKTWDILANGTSFYVTEAGVADRLVIAAGGTVTLNGGGSDANLRLRSGSNRSGIFIDKPGTTTVMGSALVLASDESYRLGTASYYHVVCQQGGGTLLQYQGNTKLTTNSSGVEIGNDGNTDYALIGPTKIGGGFGHGDYAGFSHRDRSTTTSYALLQHTGGTTYLNSNIRIYMGVNNANYTAQVESDRFQVNNNLTVVGSASLSTDGSWVNIGGANVFRKSNNFLYFGNANFSSGLYTRINVRLENGYNISPYSSSPSSSTTLGTSANRWPTIYGAAGDFSGNLTVGGYARSENITYAANQDVAYLIAGTSGWTGATTNWNTYGFQHRIKTNSGGVPRVTIDRAGGEAFSVDNSSNVAVGNNLTVGGNLTVTGTISAGNADTLDSLDSTQFLRSDANDTTTGRLTIANTSGADGLVIAGGENTGISARLFFETGTSGQGTSILNIGGGFQFRTGATAGSSSGAERMHLSSGGTLYPQSDGQDLGTSTKRWELKATSGNFSGQAEFQNKLHLIGLTLDSGSTPSYIKIKTKIPFASSAADFTVNIKGFQYGSARTVDLKICWHYYNSTFYNATISSAGGWLPTAQLSAEDDNGTDMVCIVLASPGYWPKMYVESAYSKYYGSSTNYFTGWTWTDAAASGTGNKLVTLTYNNKFGNVQFNGEATFSDQDTRWTYSGNKYLRSDQAFYFLANSSGSAQRASFSSVQVSDTYSGTPPTNGVLFGTDTQLYRSAANTLSLGSDDSLVVPQGLTVSSWLYPNNGISIPDSKKILLGNQSDLQIYHDGNNWIDANGVGDLYLRNLNSSGDVIVQAGASGDVYLKVNSGETAFKATNNGATELYHNNAKKFETLSNGAKVTGYLFGSDGEILAGQDSGGYYFATGASPSINKPVFIGDNASYIRMNVGTSEKFRVTTTGATVTGNLSVSGNGVVKQIGSNAYATADLNNWYTGGTATLGQFYRYDSTHGHFQDSAGNVASNAPNTLTQSPTQIYSYGALLTLDSNSSFRSQFYMAHSASEIYYRSGWGSSGDQNWTRLVGDRNIQSVINNVGNISIGGAPSAGGKLTIHTGTNTNGLLIYEDTDDSLTHNLYIDGNDQGVMDLRNNSNAVKVQLHSGGHSFFTGGSLGINTTIPYNHLHVNGNGRINSLIVGNSAANNTPAAALHIKSSGTAAVLRIEDSDSSNQVYDFLCNQGSGLSIVDKGTGSSNNTRLFIAESTGFVGINIDTASVVSAPLTFRAAQNTPFLEVKDDQNADKSRVSFEYNYSGTDRLDINLHHPSKSTVMSLYEGDDVKIHGSLGIGVASPDNPLHIKNANPVIKLEDSDPDGVYGLLDAAGGDFIIAADGGAGSANSFISFRLDGTAASAEKVRITSTGVGIGTSANSSYNGSADNLVIDGGSADVGITLDSPNQGTLAFTEQAHTTWRGWLKYRHDTSTMEFGSGSTLMMNLTNTGLGIGTASPDANHSLTISNSTNYGIRLTGGNATIQANGNLITNSGNHTYIRPAASYKVIIDSGNGLNVTSGNLAVGTLSPSSKFHVVGASTVATTKAEMNSKSVMKLHHNNPSTTSTNMQFAGVGNGMGFQVTNYNDTANWDIYLNPFGGNVMIGSNATPAHLLTIKGDAKYFAAYASDGSQAVQLGADSSGDGNFILFDHSGGIKVKLYGESGAANYINNGGNFGIGTTSPSYKVHIHDSVHAQLAIDGDTTSQLLFGGSTNNRLIYRESDGDLDLELGGAVIATFEDGGNFGIGTASPTARLNVKASGSTVDQIAVTHSGNTVEIAQLGQSANGNSGGALLLKNNSGADKVYLDAAGSSYFTGGSLGIGTVSPNYKLQVVGTFRASDTGYFAKTSGTGLMVDHGTSFGTIASDIHYFKGKVGINKTAPDYDLEVSGSISNFGDGKIIRLRSNDYIIGQIENKGTGANYDKGYFRLFDTGTAKVVLDSAGDSYFSEDRLASEQEAPAQNYT